jgi:CHAD domain-containing protein
VSTGTRDLNDAEITHLGELIDELRTTDDLDAAIHETRKGTKRLRAHLRLARKVIDPGAYKSEDAALRDVARLLAPARDAYVVGLTLESLEEGGWDEASAYIGTHHRTVLDEFSRNDLGEAVEQLEAVRARWPDRSLDRSVIAAGLERTYHRGMAGHEAALSSELAESFHAWRKWVKYLRYQLEAIEADPEFVAPWLELGETLGLEHDHTVFIGFCDEHIDMCPDRRDRYVLIDRAGVKREALRHTALATSLFATEPEEFVGSALG